MRLSSWRPLPARRNTLIGFADIVLPIGLEISDVSVHERGGKIWASLPARPMLDTAGLALRDERGKVKYALSLRWSTHEFANQFSRRLIELIEASHGSLGRSAP